MLREGQRHTDSRMVAGLARDSFLHCLDLFIYCCVGQLGGKQMAKAPDRPPPLAALLWRVASHMFAHVYLTALPQYDGAGIKRRESANEKSPVQKVCRNEVRSHNTRRQQYDPGSLHHIRFAWGNFPESQPESCMSETGVPRTFLTQSVVRLGRPWVDSNKTQRRTHAF